MLEELSNRQSDQRKVQAHKRPGKLGNHGNLLEGMDLFLPKDSYRICGAKGGILLLLSTEKKGNHLLVKIGGELDLSTSPRFREKVEEELNYDPSIKHLVLDLQDTTFIDSSGLGVILGRFKRISAQGGKLLAVRVPSHLVKVFELSGLLRIMEICPTPEDAQKSLLGG